MLVDLYPQSNCVSYSEINNTCNFQFYAEMALTADSADSRIADLRTCGQQMACANYSGMGEKT